MMFIGAGGIAGTLCRYYLGRWLTRKAPQLFPWGTFLINITGSFLLGLLYSLHYHGTLAEWAWLFLGAGFCGGYTTFSTFSYETIQLMKNHNITAATLYVISTVLAGLLVCWIGTNIQFIPI
jgi:fluoride exporter